MSRHFWRACNREAGFSFVELLVTIIIAGIIFAAMVPGVRWGDEEELER